MEYDAAVDKESFTCTSRRGIDSSEHSVTRFLVASSYWPAAATSDDSMNNDQYDYVELVTQVLAVGCVGG
jgi:hypothetical protein